MSVGRVRSAGTARSRRAAPSAYPVSGPARPEPVLFLVVTLRGERPRPTAPRLDTAPPTSGFPSGHVGAAVALRGGLAVLAALRQRGSGHRSRT